MDINFPLILVVLVFVSGVIWLIDIKFFAASRRRAVVGVEAQFKDADLSDDKIQLAYNSAKQAAAREPWPIEYSKSFFPVLFVVLILRSFLVEPFQIPSGSMIPTLKIGDFILVNKYAYGIRLPVVRTKVMDINDPERGDVMVFFPPHQSIYYIKRVIGLPGDEIRYTNNQLYINGEEMPQTLLASLPPAAPQYQIMSEDLYGVEHDMRKNIIPGRLSRDGSWVVPEGHYFMMGDNRDNSSDSREWGPVPEENIVGKAFAVWMHWDSFLSVPSFKHVGEIK